MSEREEEMRSRRLGADGYMVEPVDFDALHAVIDARLSGVGTTPRTIAALARFLRGSQPLSRRRWRPIARPAR